MTSTKSANDVRGWSVTVTRPSEMVSLFEVSLSDYHEFFFVAEGERSITITMFEPAGEAYPEPQTFVFAKPYGWRRDLDEDEALLQVWQAVGVQR